MNVNRSQALMVQRAVVLGLLMAFLAVLVGVTAVTVGDPSPVLFPAILAGLVGTLGLAVLLGAYRRAAATLAEPSVTEHALRLASIARSILIVGAVAVVVLGAALGAALSDGSVMLTGVGAAAGPALASIVASTARKQFTTRVPQPGQ
jgi:hypothetical protein